ncbi:thioredoxin family protein [Kouleothrix sp.]|uniref:thioredoxin family protein n=1 Tax=Kouleothrix sp. TaxID=2779161 RepID=UPI00391C49ED
MSTAHPGSATPIRVGEAGFARRVRAAAVPVVALFGAAGCAASRELAAQLGQLAAQYGGQLLVLWLDVERAHVLAEQYAIGATPTLLVLRDGEELTRVVGFAPAPLVRVLFEQILADALAPGRLWCPVEQVFEDAVLIPLLDAWGWRYRRQVACPGAANRGRVDILVYDDNMLAPRTLFENKRQIGSQAALQQAATQARRYAEQFGLPTFVVAAPAGLWVYRLDDGQARLFQAYSSLDIAQHSARIREALRWA